jgi:rare lipoprotein A
LFSTVILTMTFYSNLVTKAHACAAWSGQVGVASWYGPGMQGNRTANGETFDMWAMTAAANACLPLGTRIRVTVLNTGRTIIVTVNDRLPSRRRILDLSVGAARALGIASQGLAMIQISPG